MADISKITLPDNAQYHVKDSAARGIYGSVTLSATWSGDGPYTQTVTVNGYTVTAKTRVDLLSDTTVLTRLMTDGVIHIYVSNNNASLTAIAVGGKPSTALTVPAMFTEVA